MIPSKWKVWCNKRKKKGGLGVERVFQESSQKSSHVKMFKRKKIEEKALIVTLRKISHQESVGKVQRLSIVE